MTALVTDAAPMDDPPPQLAQLYRDLAPLLLAYFRRQRALATAADDLLQDTFVRAARHPERIRTAASPRAYLFGIARHVGLDALRRRRPEAEELGEIAVETVSEDARLGPMRAAIAALPALQREPLLLRLHQELDYAEIAEVLGIPVGTVRSRLHHAVRQLRDSLNPPAP